MAKKITKLNLYVDESGTDQQAPGFVVAVVIIANEITELLHRLEEIEQESGRGTFKWRQSGREEKQEYIDLIKKEPRLKNAIYCQRHSKGASAKESTYVTISRAIKSHTLTNNIDLYAAVVTIDGLGRNERDSTANALRKRGVLLRKLIRGTRDESSSILRLADAIAGLERELITDSKLKKIRISKNLIIEL